MENDQIYAPVVLISNTTPMTSAAYGGRAKCAQRLIRLEMPVPTTVALSFLAVHEIATGNAIDPDLVLPHFDLYYQFDRLLAVQIGVALGPF